MGKRRMNSNEHPGMIVAEAYETFRSMLNAGENFEEAYKTAREMLPRGCGRQFDELVSGNMEYIA